jgi:hypothetical protein
MKIVPAIFFMCMTTEAFAQMPQAKGDISFAVEQASEICLAGTKYKLELNGEGKLNILRVQPGGEVSVVVGVQKSKGGVDFNDEKVREIFDEKTRDCMKEMWRDVLIQLRQKSETPAQTEAGKAVVQFRFDRNWVRYRERTNLSTIRTADGRAVYEPIERSIATINFDGSKAGQVYVDNRSDVVVPGVARGDHFFSVSMTVPGNQVLQCRDEFVFVDVSSAYKVTAVVNKNYASTQNDISCQLEKVPIDR